MTIQLDRAISLVRARALLFMTSTVVIKRHARPGFDSSTGRAPAGSSTTIYTGPARIWEVTQGGVVAVGEDEINLENTELSIPYDVSPVPIKGDLAKVTASDDVNLVGRVFSLQSMAKSGLMRPTRRYRVTLVEERTVS